MKKECGLYRKIIEGEPKFVIVEASGGHLTRIAWQEVLHGTSKGSLTTLGVRIAIGLWFFVAVVFL